MVAMGVNLGGGCPTCGCPTTPEARHLILEILKASAHGRPDLVVLVERLEREWEVEPR